MVTRLLMVFFALCVSYGSFATSDGDCETAIKTLFADKVTKEDAADFLKVQGDITLHRLAWAYLKAQKTDQTEKLENVERTILTLLDEKYTSTDPNFIKARNTFESQPLSRSTLEDIAPYLKDVLSHEFGKESAPFVLNASDLKMLHSIAKFEKKSAINGKFESRMLAQKSPEGMLNFVKLINSAYKTNQSPSEEAIGVELQLKGLEKTLAGLQKRLNNFLATLPVPSQCMDEILCEKTDFPSLFNQNENIQNIFWTSLEDKLLSDDLLLDHMTYGELWLKTSGKIQGPTTGQDQNSTATTSHSSVHQRSTVVGKTTKVSPVSPVSTFYASSTGLYIEDPIEIIIKDKKERKPEDWKSFDKKYLQAMSDAILNDDKVFECDGHLCDRKTGRSISLDKALELLPPKQREEFKKDLKTNDPGLASSQVRAKVNGDQSFIYKGKLYNLKGIILSPEWMIASEMSKKNGILIQPSRYSGMENGYLVARADGLLNNKPHFIYKNQVYDSQTGRNLSSPFRSLASTEDVKINKQRRVLYQNLSDKETIVNFHRDNPKKDGCQHYAIIDKKNAEISVYNLSGTLVYKTEVLIGVNASDAKTKWSEYNEREKLSSKTTGAGSFTIGEPKKGDYYTKNYSNNLLQIQGQNVFAIHQVPNNLQQRYSAFGTGNPMDRRITGGCANLKKADYLKLVSWIKPTCQVYVLPEEPNNKFIVKDGRLEFVSTTAVANANNYNYSHNGPTYKQIKINITNSNGRSTDSVPFVKALEDEKKKLMELFNLSNDDYNDLASVAYGIMGNESDFGRSKKYWIKEHDQGDVILAKAAKRLFNGQNPFDKSVLNTSRGFTQIKELPDGAWRKAYPGISKETLGDPKNSAVSTIAYLVGAVKSLKSIARENANDPRKVRITKENLVDYLGYIYQGRRGALKSADDPANADFNTYVQNLRKHMSYIEIAQKIE